MASIIAFMDRNAAPLLYRNYKGDVPTAALHAFPNLLMEYDNNCPPILSYNGITYLFLQHNNIYILALSGRNSDAMQIMTYLEHLIAVLQAYMKNVEEESIRDNFTIIYELLDEMMDYGKPQITESSVLKEYITQEFQEMNALSIARTSTNGINWRPKGIFYKKNELFLDVVESINLLVDCDGKILKNEIFGRIEAKCYLSGIPDVKLGLNDEIRTSAQVASLRNISGVDNAIKKNQLRSVHLQDTKFHQCVQLPKFTADRSINFVPPDGSFQLMSYRAKPKLNNLFAFDSHITHYGKKNDKSVIRINRISYRVNIASNFRKKLTAHNVEIRIPVPLDTTSPKFKTKTGQVYYAPELNAIIWKISSFAGGGKNASLKAEVSLTSVTDFEESEGINGDGNRGKTVDGDGVSNMHYQTISVQFEIPYFTVSGLQVKFLKVYEPQLSYPSLPWVRYLTKNSDEYCFRVKPRVVLDEERT